MLASMMLVERETPVVTAHGHMATHVVYPAGSVRLPAIVLFMDAPGIRDELLNMARRVARAGYYCAVPDLYYRFGRIRLDLTRRTEAHADLYRMLSASLINGMIATDTANLLGHLSAQAEVREGAMGCLGFSVGGRFAVQAAGLFPNHIAAAAAVCGTGIVTDKDDSPHLTLARARAQMLFEFAATDPQVPPHVIPTLQATLSAAGQGHQINVEHGTRHGYSFPMRPMYDSIAAQNSWQRIFELFSQSL